MLEWAKREIEMAKESEKLDIENMSMEFDYAGACYDSAIKAFESLIKDNHSGYSISITKNILNRLIEGKVLTPIEDTPDIWNEVTSNEKEIMYQCRRMSSLFKYVYQDGVVKYSDISSSYCVDIDSPQTTWHSGLVQSIIDAMFPISMPYMPSNNPMVIYCKEFLTDVNNGDFDTLGILHLISHNGEKIDVGKYFKEELNGWIEIGVDEYNERHSRQIIRE